MPIEEIDLKDIDEGGKTSNYQIKTIIKTNRTLGFEVVDQKINEIGNGTNREIKQEDFYWNKIFVAAYGAGLRTEGNEDYGQFFAADAVYSLFKYSWPMQNPELIWRRLREVARDSEVNKLKKDKAGLEESMEELEDDLDENKFAGFLKPLTESTSPVLEKVASAEDLNMGRFFSNTKQPQTDDKNEESSNYASFSSEYATASQNQETEHGSQYIETADAFGRLQNDKEHKETRRLFKISNYDSTRGNKRDNFEGIISPEVEDKEGKQKYFTNRDRNS